MKKNPGNLLRNIWPQLSPEKDLVASSLSKQG